jgi:hypothetical protein
VQLRCVVLLIASNRLCVLVSRSCWPAPVWPSRRLCAARSSRRRPPFTSRTSSQSCRRYVELLVRLCGDFWWLRLVVEFLLNRTLFSQLICSPSHCAGRGDEVPLQGGLLLQQGAVSCCEMLSWLWWVCPVRLVCLLWRAFRTDVHCDWRVISKDLGLFKMLPWCFPNMSHQKL